MKPIEIIAKDLFEKVRSRFTNLQMGDENGAVTSNPQDARFFDFDFVIENNNLGRVSISINELGNLKIFYGQGITEDSDSIIQGMWYDFLREMRFFAKRRLLRFDTRDIVKGNLDKTDFQYLAQNGPKDKNMNESSMFGSSKTSHRRLEDTDLIIRHTEAIDPTKPGARSRKIKNLFIQNKEGERFKFPFVYLPGARAMQRHVSNGGYPHDVAGKKIIKACEEILMLSDFGRKVKNSTLNDNANAIAERAGQKLSQLRHHMECLSKQKYYETWAEAANTEDDHLIELDAATLESYKDTFTINKFDEALSDMFPLLHSIMQETSELDLGKYVSEVSKDEEEALESLRNDEFRTFESWTESLIGEGFSDDELKSLEALCQEPLPVGASDEAVQALAGIGIKDPDLVNALRAVAKMPNGADADAREIIKTYLGPDAEKINWGDMGSSATPPAPTPTPPPAAEAPPAEEPMAEPAATEEPVAAESSDDDESFVKSLRRKFAKNREDSIEPDDKHKLIEPETDGKAGGKMKEVAQIVMGFYDRENGTWTRGEHGVVTHVKRAFSGDSGKGGGKEAALAAKLIQHLNQQHEARHAFEDIRKLAGLAVVEAKKPSAGLTKKEKSATVKKAKAGGDIGKKGKNFDKVAKAAGGGEKGKKIAAAAMWKNIKR